MRYIPNTPDDRQAMLRDIGVSSFEDLLKPIPKSLRLSRPLNIPKGKSEQEVVATMTSLARKNLDAASFLSFLGAGSYDHYVPAAVGDLAGRSEFLTAYTPYQPEVSQGTLQVIYEFQSMICELFRMNAANASLYDGGTALAEAVMLAQSHTRRSRVLWFDSVHPHYRKVTRTLGDPLGIRFDTMPLTDGRVKDAALDSTLDVETAAVVFQYPNFFGLIEHLEPLIERVHAAGALAIVVADPLAMGVLEPPGNWDADIVVGEGQALGNPQSYGGPYLGLFAVSEKLVRRAPGRIAGITRDVDGRRGYVLTLQTREQHIRRDKATSNICTNEGLCATRATIFLSLVGPQGLREIGETCMKNCNYLRNKLSEIPGVQLLFDGLHFKEFVFRLKGDVPAFLEFMAKRDILPGIPLKRFNMGLDDALLVALTERRTADEMDRYADAVRAFLKGSPS
ncbi:aminomethyl-transferring glycine dehydrogenase subunit GcvPA [bacterium]|nr:aminomethyl-transferring glycine dehydrogenase subunit GcvPA [bacterium]MBU1983304.1 aminomethyl-transferring glycine dehydrogenase subunit GcvPA [bacterium]